jgi:signal transduction histidine kinase
VDRLNRTVSGSLRLARSGSVVLQPLRLSAALEPAIQAAIPQFEARGVTLQRERSEPNEDAWLRGDPDALTQLFLNILVNAAEAVDRAGKVAVSMSSPNGTIEVVVSDNGPGMSPETLRLLDEPFHTTKRQGTGLGLKIARRIAAAHGGRIEIHSAPGAGTQVTICLPRGGDAAIA